MIAWNGFDIPQWGGYLQGWVRSKDFLFFTHMSAVPLVAVKKGWLVAENIEDFP